MRKEIRLVVGLLVSLTPPAMAQGNPIADRITQRIQESRDYFAKGDYSMGANRVSEAASMLKSSPNAMPGTSAVDLASSAVESLHSKAQSAKGNPAQYVKLSMAQQSLLSSLKTWEPQNPRWHYLSGVAFRAQAGGPTINVAGDRASLQMAIREFDAALAAPGSEGVAGDCSRQKAECQKLLSQRVAKGKEIQRRGVREMYKYRGAPVDIGAPERGWCSSCNHYHAPGDHD